MKFLLYLSQFILPFLIFCIVGAGMASKTPVYDCFVRGAKDGLKITAHLVPTLIGLMTATGILRASGFLDFAAEGLQKLIGGTLFPTELVPLTVLRMFSSSAATGLLLDVYEQYGTDSRTGLTASLLMCCTETVFYTMSVYFMTVRVTKTRYTLAGALIATFAGIVASTLLAAWM